VWMKPCSYTIARPRPCILTHTFSLKTPFRTVIDETVVLLRRSDYSTYVAEDRGGAGRGGHASSRNVIGSSAMTPELGGGRLISERMLRHKACLKRL